MLTLDVYAFEDGPSQTLVRSLNSGGAFILIRQGREAARYACHMNHPLSLGDNGLLLFDDGMSGPSKRTVDLRRDFPQDPRLTFGGEVLDPAGESLLGYFMEAFPYADPVTGEQQTGLVRIDRLSGRGETVWQGDTSRPVRIYPFGRAVEEALSEYDKKFWKPITDPIEFPALILSPSGAAWALGKPDRLEIGREGQRRASVYWEEFDFSYAQAAFSPEEDRIILAGRPGLTVISLDGEVITHWQARLPCEPTADAWGRTITEIDTPAASPPLFRGADLLVVLQVLEDRSHSTEQRWYEVHRFDPQTLAHRGPLVGFPRRRLGHEASILVPLQDGGLAWVPNQDPVLILPAGDTDRRSTELVRVVGDELPPRLPHPRGGWYDREIGAYGSAPPLGEASPEQRKSLAHFLLNEGVPDYRFEALVKMDSDAFHPYRDIVLGWSREEMERIWGMDPRHYWMISRGASNEAVQALAGRIEAYLPEIHLAEFELFLGVETPLALELAADFARRSPRAARYCRAHLLWVPEHGPAVSRCTPALRQFVLYPADEVPGPRDPGLALNLDPADYLPEGQGWACRAPLAHLLTARLDRVPGNHSLADSPLRAHHWFLSNCEEGCDEALNTHYVFRGIDHRRVELIGNLLDPGPRLPEAARDDNPGSAEPPPEDQIVTVEAYRLRAGSWTVRVIGQLGGWPDWWQQPEVPDCPSCGRMMFFVGQVHASKAREDMPDAMLYGFHCEDCGIGVQISQIT